MKTNTKHNLPLDQYKHINLPDAKTDPYGSLEFAIGTGDDFYCFDYAFFEHQGRNFLVLHSVINSETGSFIMDGEYRVIDRAECHEGEELLAAMDMVGTALDWMDDGGDKPLRHSKSGWNQDPFYFVRALARSLYRHGTESEGIAALSRDARAFRYGGAKLNREIERVAPGLKGQLPITRRPQFRCASK